MTPTAAPQVLILACGALAREIRDIARLHELGNVTLECIPAALHMTPDLIAPAVRRRLERHQGAFDRILVGYADCGTGGHLVDLCREFTTGTTIVEMMPGAHCYQFFTGNEAFLEMHDDDPTAFYLTDYLVKHFERLIIGGLGIAEHPELQAMYFGNYTKLIHLAQTDDPTLDDKARAAAARLDLSFERRRTGYGELESEILEIAR
ncbi:MAG: DUF1638 domain-containing protein [Acidimicrobiales bacterium]